MEIQEIRRTQLRTYAAAAQPAAKTAEPAPKTDKLILSRQAAGFLRARQEEMQEAMARQEQKMREAQAEAESGKDELDALGEQLKMMQRCQEISRRIMRGDKVPPEDERYLMENDPEGYKLTLAMRQVKRNPKKWESVLKDDEQKTKETGDSSGDDMAVSETSGGEAASSGGSDTSGSTE